MKKRIATYALLFVMLLTACSTSQPSTTNPVANGMKVWVIFDTTEEMRGFITLAERSDVEAEEEAEAYLAADSDYFSLGDKEDMCNFLNEIDGREFLWLDFENLPMKFFRSDAGDGTLDSYFCKYDSNLFAFIQEWNVYPSDWVKNTTITKIFHIDGYELKMGPLEYINDEDDPRTSWTGFMFTETTVFRFKVVARDPRYQNTVFLTSENFSMMTFRELAEVTD